LRARRPPAADGSLPTLLSGWHQASASLKRRLPGGDGGPLPRPTPAAATAIVSARASAALDPGRRLMPCGTQVGSGGMVGAGPTIGMRIWATRAAAKAHTPLFPALDGPEHGATLAAGRDRPSWRAGMALGIGHQKVPRRRQSAPSSPGSGCSQLPPATSSVPLEASERPICAPTPLTGPWARRCARRTGKAPWTRRIRPLLNLGRSIA
jgi:hypothetical protein